MHRLYLWYAHEPKRSCARAPTYYVFVPCAPPRIIGALARLYCSVVRLRACISYICGALARPVRLRARHVVWCAYALVILLSAFARLAGTLVRLPSVARARARQWMRAVA